MHTSNHSLTFPSLPFLHPSPHPQVTQKKAAREHEEGRQISDEVRPKALSSRLVHACVWVAPPALPSHLSFSPSPPSMLLLLRHKRHKQHEEEEIHLFLLLPSHPPSLHPLECGSPHTPLMPLPCHRLSHTLIKTRRACFICRRKKSLALFWFLFSPPVLVRTQQDTITHLLSLPRTLTFSHSTPCSAPQAQGKSLRAFHRRRNFQKRNTTSSKQQAKTHGKDLPWSSLPPLREHAVGLSLLCGPSSSPGPGGTRPSSSRWLVLGRETATPGEEERR